MDERLFERQRTWFGTEADTYDRYRPAWPAPTAAWLCGSAPSAAGDDAAAPLDVLDLGAGTGKLTRTLVDLGHRVTAVDPSEGMLAVLQASLPRITTRVGTAERIPLPDAGVDAITVAQAWHWMRPAEAGAECARVLRPGGVLGIGWHTRTDDRAWLRELDALMGAPDDRPGRSVRERPEDLRLPAPFGPIEAEVFAHESRLEPAGVAALASSFSYVAVQEDRERILAGVERLAGSVADDDGLVTIPYRTRCYRSRVPA